MTIEQIQSDESIRLAEFPVAEKTIYLSHAAVCPLPNCARNAISNYATACVEGAQEDFMPPNLLRNTREQAAKLIGANMKEIALIGPTSLGLSFIAQGSNWQSGDNIIIHADDYPSNVYPWMALEEKGVALVPGTSFGNSAEDFVRISYANSMENLEKAIYRLSTI